MTRYISSADANRQFSEILGQAARGEKVVITRMGDPVAQLGPFNPTAGAANDDAWTRLLSTLDVGLPLGGATFEREDLYDR